MKKRPMTPEEQQSITELREKLIDIEHLKKSKGWELLLEYLKHQERHCYDTLSLSGNEVETFKAIGGHLAVKSVMEWPDMQIAGLSNTLKQQLGSDE